MGPVALVGAGAQPGLQEGAVPVDAVAAAHEDGVGEAVARVGHARGVQLALGQEAHGEGEEDLLGAGAGRGGVGVEVLQRHAVAVPVGLRIGPMDEVLRGAALDRPHPAAVGPRSSG